MSVLICILCGMVIGYFYDFFRAIRKTSGYNAFLTLISDFLFWVIAGSLTLFSFFYIDGLNLRAYRFFAVICGAFLYFIFLSPVFLLISEKILNIFVYFFKILFTILKFCVKIIYIVINAVLFPFKFIYKYIAVAFRKLWGQLGKIKRISKRI